MIAINARGKCKKQGGVDEMVAVGGDEREV